MIDRHAVGDLALAVMLALPLAVLARTQPAPHHASAAPAAVTIAMADRAPAGRMGLLG